MRLFILIALLLISGCAQFTVDSQMKPYLESFEKEASIRHVRTDRNIGIVFGKVETGLHQVEDKTMNSVGECRDMFTAYPYVVIDKVYWDTISNQDRETLIFHELGHCWLDRQHTDSRKETSIMQGWILSYPEADRKKLLDELFDGYRKR